MALIDASTELAGSFRLVDVHLGRAGTVTLELRDAGTSDRLYIEIRERIGEQPAYLRTDWLDISYRTPERAELTDAVCAACRELAAILEQSSFTEIVELVRPSKQTEAAEAVPLAALGREGKLLKADLAAYARTFGAAPIALRAPGPDAYAIRFPVLAEAAVPPGTYLYRAPSQFLERRKFRDYLWRLGFAADADSNMRTVPTPASFLQLAARAGVRPTFHAALLPSLRTTLRMKLWLGSVLRRVFPINVSPSFIYQLRAALARTPLGDRVKVEKADIGLLVHDMGVHVFALHRIPEARAREIVTKIQGTLRRHWRPWSVPESLTSFFEVDLTRHCQELWREIDAPEEFEAAFEAAYPKLAAVLQTRIGEAPARYVSY